MKDIGWETNEEKRRNIGLQHAIGALENGWIGNQTLTEMAAKLCPEIFPITVAMYGMPVIMARDLVAFNPGGPLKDYANAMLGSFTYPRATKPCSILVNDGKVIFDQACRAWAGYPEAVIYRLNNGAIGHGEYRYAKDLPKGTKWAIGGFGLMDLYNPSGQGFKTIDGSDFYNTVAYRTDHNVLGAKNGILYGVYYKNMTDKEINAHCKEKMRFDFAIMLDGGGLASMNGKESFAKIKTGIKCGYAVQFI